MTQSLNSRMGGTLHGGFFEDCVERIQSFADFFGILGDSLGILLCISCNKYWWFWLLHSPPPLPPPPPPPPRFMRYDFVWQLRSTFALKLGFRSNIRFEFRPVESSHVHCFFSDGSDRSAIKITSPRNVNWRGLLLPPHHPPTPLLPWQRLMEFKRSLVMWRQNAWPCG